jgi:hypothetical protein
VTNSIVPQLHPITPNILGQKFGKWTVIEFAGYKVTSQKTGNRQAFWVCECECGNYGEIASNNLKRRVSTQCTSCALVKHGLSDHPLYRTWSMMIDRCYNPNCPHYRYYGGRGVRVCDRWLTGFDHFLADMGEKPSQAHTLDRVAINGNYEPSNCRWADRSTQNVNQRMKKTNKSGATGVNWHKASNKWVAQVCRGRKKVHIGLFDTVEAAKQARDKFLSENNMLANPH